MKILNLNRIAVIIALLFILPAKSFAVKVESSKSKTISKSYQVGADHKLEIDSQFGEVKITTWDKKEISVNITIIVGGKNDEKVQKKLDEIEIKIKESSDLTSFETIVDSKNQKLDDDNKLEINYDVKMPKSNALKVKHSFGPFIINDLDGAAEIRVSFGSATIGSLNNESCQLKFDFSDPVAVSSVKNASIDVKYSKLTLDKANNIELTSQFSGSTIGNVNSINGNLKFGSLDAESIKSIDVKSQMSKIKLQNLDESAKLNLKYGSLKIEKLNKAFKQIEIDGEFSPIKLTVEKGAAMQVYLRASMASISAPNADWKEKETNNTAKKYVGSFGQAPNANLTINSSFGSIDLDF